MTPPSAFLARTLAASVRLRRTTAPPALPDITLMALIASIAWQTALLAPAAVPVISVQVDIGLAEVHAFLVHHPAKLVMED